DDVVAALILAARLQRGVQCDQIRIERHGLDDAEHLADALGAVVAQACEPAIVLADQPRDLAYALDRPADLGHGAVESAAAEGSPGPEFGEVHVAYTLRLAHR